MLEGIFKDSARLLPQSGSVGLPALLLVGLLAVLALWLAFKRGKSQGWLGGEAHER
jgi:LPXTG-motif cell wall-anchored protein